MLAPIKSMQEQIRQLERKVSILTRLAEVSTFMNSTLQIEPLLKYIMDAAAEITDSEGASVLLYSRKTHELFFAATTSGGQALDFIGMPVPMDGSIAGTIVKERRIVQVDDVTNDPRHYAKFDEDTNFSTRSVLGVPMTVKDKVIGVLEVVNKRHLRWTQDDSHYLSILAAQAAVAIESAQLVTALRKANQELSELDQLKNDFIAIASHELRTPLGVLLGYASFLQEETSNDEINEHVTKVLESAMQLRRIIEDLANLRYLQQNETELRREETSLAVIFDDVTQHQDVLEVATVKRHKMDIAVPSSEMLVFIDRGRVALALTNILINAVRFTPAGGYITMQSSTHNNEVWIQVKDSGVGLAKDKIERIFDKFYQVEDHHTRHHGGLGIGLSIAKALIEAHGGRIWADSDGIGKGATFTVALPLAQTAVAQ